MLSAHRRRETLATIFPLVRRSVALARSDSLYRNSTFLAANALANALAGFVFWVIAARIVSSKAVGLAAAVVSVGSLVAAFSYLGFDNALIKYLPTSPTKDRDANTALTISGVASIVGVGIALAIAAASGSQLRQLTSSPLSILAFATLCLMTCWNSLTNIVFIADRIAQYVLLTTLAFSFVRYPFLFILRHDGYSDVTVAWLIGLVLSVVLSFLILYKVTGYMYRPSFDVLSARRMVRFASANYVSSVASNIPALLLPSIILNCDRTAICRVLLCRVPHNHLHLHATPSGVPVAVRRGLEGP